MISFSPNVAGKGNTHHTVGMDIGMDTLKPLPGIVVLPSFGTDALVSQQHEVNPAIAINLLQDIQSTVLVWQTQLRQLVRSLRSLQAQGPMVEGWLESSAEVATAVTTDSTLFRHGDTAALMRYVESLDQSSQAQSISSNAISSNAVSSSSSAWAASAAPQPVQPPVQPPKMHSATQYRLCRLDDSGQLRSQPCPAEQLGIVSMAIARHQKYKQLLLQKQAIESKLQRAVNQLTGVRAALREE